MEKCYIEKIETIFVIDAIKGGNRKPDDAERAVGEMVKKGAKKQLCLRLHRFC
ncbi:MAG: hypothetical protein PVH73_07845 [Candidatus Bathyarchaeota archaeon]